MVEKQPGRPKRGVNAKDPIVNELLRAADKRGWTNAVFGAETGIQAGVISRIRNGRKAASLRHVTAMCKALNLKLVILLDTEED